MFSENSENSKIRIRTSDIPTSWLNARCRNVISKYALKAFRHDGTIFDLRSEKIISRVSRHCRDHGNDELREIYLQLKHELRVLISNPQMRVALSIMAEKYEYMESSDWHNNNLKN